MLNIAHLDSVILLIKVNTAIKVSERLTEVQWLWGRYLIVGTKYVHFQALVYLKTLTFHLTCNISKIKQKMGIRVGLYLCENKVLYVTKNEKKIMLICLYYIHIF